ncbi:MAG: hypothetical protein K1Y36_02515 [Blastocatellia bacterium]|nr:hypothetical protein [Blastocatellia bacterium]
MHLEKVKIKRVTPVGVEKTYNMTMAAPHHNYLANGVLTANSHSVCYGVLAYHTAYLKAHYPAHFWAAVLSNELNNTDKVAKYIERARAAGIEILPPDVNVSYHTFTSTSDKIRFGLMAIKGIGEAAVDAIVAAREKEGPFTSLHNLTERVDSRSLNRRVLESLIKSGGMDTLPGTRAQKFAAIDGAIENGARAQRDRQSGQVSLFGAFEATMPSEETALPQVADWTPAEQLAGEKATVGFYITGHPLAEYRELLNQFASASFETLASNAPGTIVKMGGMVVGYVVKTTKKGDRFCVFALEDELGSIEVIAWPETFKKLNGRVSDTQAVLVTGKLEFTEDGPSKIIADEVVPLAGLRERSAAAMKLYFPAGQLNEQRVDRLYGLFDRHRGECAVTFEVQLSSGAIAVVRPNSFVRVKASPELVTEIRQICTGCEVAFQ